MYLKKICHEIGVPLGKDKSTKPCTVLTSLGIEFDTQELVMRLLIEKLVNLKEKIKVVLRIKKDMQSLLRLLNFACKVVVTGRTFCRRLLNSTIGVRKPFTKFGLTIR